MGLFVLDCAGVPKSPSPFSQSRPVKGSRRGSLTHAPPPYRASLFLTVSPLHERVSDRQLARCCKSAAIPLVNHLGSGQSSLPCRGSTSSGASDSKRSISCAACVRTSCSRYPDPESDVHTTIHLSRRPSSIANTGLAGTDRHRLETDSLYRLVKSRRRITSTYHLHCIQ